MKEKSFHHLCIITTGGTIEKTYDELHGSLENKLTELEKRVLHRLRLPYMSYEVIAPFSKDSLHFTLEDRQKVLELAKKAISSGRFSALLIIHGTDTMDQTAEFLRLGLTPKIDIPVVFTGAMKPMGFEDSDATQNVTEAILATKFCGPGVFISFHGEIFDLPNVRKNRKKLTFESTD